MKMLAKINAYLYKISLYLSVVFPFLLGGIFYNVINFIDRQGKTDIGLNFPLFSLIIFLFIITISFFSFVVRLFLKKKILDIIFLFISVIFASLIFVLPILPFINLLSSDFIFYLIPRDTIILPSVFAPAGSLPPTEIRYLNQAKYKLSLTITQILFIITIIISFFYSVKNILLYKNEGGQAN